MTKEFKKNLRGAYELHINKKFTGVSFFIPNGFKIEDYADKIEYIGNSQSNNICFRITSTPSQFKKAHIESINEINFKNGLVVNVAENIYIGLSKNVSLCADTSGKSLSFDSFILRSNQDTTFNFSSELTREEKKSKDEVEKDLMVCVSIKKKLKSSLMAEYITTRTYYSKKLDEQTYAELTLIAKRLGILRKIIWHQFSSDPKRLNDRKIRDIWLREKENGTNLYPKIIDQLPARLWKETLRDTIGTINAYFEAGFTEIIKRLYKKYGKAEAKELAKILKTDYKANNELHRMVRTLIPKGYSKADNIIWLDEDCYNFIDDESKIIQVMGLALRKRLSIPMTTKNRPNGNFMIILKDGRCEFRVSHKYQITNIEKPIEAIGVDKGYTEVFTDNTGERHGEGFGKLLTKKSDFLDEKYKNRNQLWAIMKKAREAGDIKKANNIKTNNLGNKKLDKQKENMKIELKEKIYSAAKVLAQKASIIAIEDLTFKTKAKKGKKPKKGKRTNRLLSSWIKGVIDEAIIKYCFIYGTKLVYVNAAYTSQGDSRFNCALMGTRIGDSFIGFDEVVLDADINAAINILARLYDSEINLYTSAEKVKEILTKRANAVLSASVETAQLGLQDVASINLELHPKSGLSKKSSKKLAKVG